MAPKQNDLDAAINGRAKNTLQTLKSPAGFAKPADTACGRSFENLLSETRADRVLGRARLAAVK
jgi:hypothetical protein